MFLTFIKDNVAFFTVVSVALGWFLTRRGQIHTERAKNSYSVLIGDNNKLRETSKLLGEYLDQSKVYVELDPKSAVSAAIWDSLQEMEKTAVAVDMGYLSEEFLYKQNRTLIMRTFIVSHAYVSKIREAKDSNTIYKNFEVLFIRSAFHTRSLLQNIFEILVVCPSFRLTGRIFAAHLNTQDKSFVDFLIAVWRNDPLPRTISYVAALPAAQETYNKRMNQLVCTECSILAIFAIVLFGFVF